MGEHILHIPIDHIGIVGSNLESMINAFAKLGFHTTGVTSLDLGDTNDQPASQNAHFVFNFGYMELIASKGTDHLADYVQKYEGMHILAMASGQAQASFEIFKRNGLDPGKVFLSTRYAAHGERTGTAAFEWFGFNEQTFPEGLVCVVQHHTPELIYQPKRIVQPNGVYGLVEVLLLVNDLDEAIERYAQMSYVNCQVNPLKDTPTWCEKLTILNTDGIRLRFPGLVTKASTGFLGIVLAVNDLGLVKDILRTSGVVFHLGLQGDVWVQPNDAAGCLVVFRELG
ncbi:VOC family protein [Paenibacillus roseipurpureus]|uniref:VOC family protein n=1 Tax=Paenibacillus roseopurpureus TaxID=2918901 RepID=A0AA96RKW3_9BACL|nr:VOC family protein [Paenibacillus sp. MBLB1832]WNR46803.1 VOC family protein [Paenibacillus sp. MBLB1832]